MNIKIIKIISFSILTFIFILQMNSTLISAEIGEVLHIEGDAQVSSIITGKRLYIDRGTILKNSQKIRTLDDNSFVDILLYNKTRIKVYGRTDLSLINIRKKKIDPATKLILGFGKIRIISKKTFNNKTLVLLTPTAIISIVLADFSVIASEYETRILVREGRVGVANIIKKIKKAYVITNREEVSIFEEEAPTYPVSLPKKYINRWLDYFIIINNKIVRKNRKHDIVDWIIKEKGDE